MPIYWEEPQTIYQSWKGVKSENNIDEDGDDEVVAPNHKWSLITWWSQLQKNQLNHQH
jgi:hypothetical protein